MNERRRLIGNASASLVHGFSGFTPARTASLVMLLLAGVAFMGASFTVLGEEALMLAPWWMRAVQGLFVVCVVLSTWLAAKGLPMMPDRRTGILSRSSWAPSYVALVFCFLLSHPLLWGGLHHLHPGQAVKVRATVVASGHRAGRAARGHGDWVDIHMEGSSTVTRLETDAMFALNSAEGSRPSYQCELKDTRAGDTLGLEGNRSVWGFAVRNIVPLNERLLAACHPATRG